MQQLYRVGFFKKLVDSTGHPYDVRQGTVEVRGGTETYAIEEARREFAAMNDVSHWSLRADYELAESIADREGDAIGRAVPRAEHPTRRVVR
jgi:hypothetical protein